MPTQKTTTTATTKKPSSLKAKNTPAPPSPEASPEVAEWFTKARDRYDKTAHHKYAKFLILGHIGMGKTFSLRTAPKPVLIHSFDPNGAAGLKRWIKTGEIIYDGRFEKDDPTNPKAFLLWQQVINDMFKKGIFNHIGTYVIDSYTMFAQALASAILHENNRAPSPDRMVLYHGRATGARKTASTLEMRDYGVLLQSAMTAIDRIKTLPCHLILNAHLITRVNEETGTHFDEPMMAGSSKKFIPSRFEEVYIAETRRFKGNLEYVWQLTPRDTVQARSRLFGDALPNGPILQDFREVLKQTGCNYEDKPLFSGTVPPTK